MPSSPPLSAMLQAFNPTIARNHREQKDINVAGGDPEHRIRGVALRSTLWYATRCLCRSLTVSVRLTPALPQSPHISIAHVEFDVRPETSQPGNWSIAVVFLLQVGEKVEQFLPRGGLTKPITLVAQRQRTSKGHLLPLPPLLSRHGSRTGYDRPPLIVTLTSIGNSVGADGHHNGDGFLGTLSRHPTPQIHQPFARVFLARRRAFILSRVDVPSPL